MGLKTHETGSLRIAAVPSLLGTVLPPILREFKTSHPGVDLSIFEGTDDEVQGWARSGIAHVGFAALPVEGVEAEEIARDEWLALVPTAKFRGRSSMGLRELACHKFLMSGGGCERHIQQIFVSAKISLDKPMMVKQMATIHAMVAENLGVSLIPRLSVVRSRSCLALPLRPRIFRQIGMIWSVTRPATPVIQAWESLVRRKLRRPKIIASANQPGSRQHTQSSNACSNQGKLSS